MRTKIARVCALVAVLCASIVNSAAAQASGTDASLNLDAQRKAWPSVSAKYQLDIGGKSAVWYFTRDEHRVRLIKGDIEEVWEKDPHGRISFERIFHADKRRVYYTANELAALGVEADWNLLCGLVDRSGQAKAPGVDLKWNQALDIPQQLIKQFPNGTLTMTLVDSAPSPLPSWPHIHAPVDDYERLDAADLGDMTYDVFALKAEAYDVRAGWRQPHAH
jgi:hypothetical protein